tara:strand:+ start:53 stop:445 length:393 start_codon:yes stop_codon:yes gene_type:complete
MKFVKFFHRYEVDGGLVLQDQECIIAAGSYILMYYPKTGEFLQIDEKVNDYPGVVSIHMNEYVARLGFFRGYRLVLKNFLGISHCSIDTSDTEEVSDNSETFEDFFEYSQPVDSDLRPPIVIVGDYNEEV